MLGFESDISFFGMTVWYACEKASASTLTPVINQVIRRLIKQCAILSHYQRN